MKISDFSGVPELKVKLDSHPLYASVRTLDDLRGFIRGKVAVRAVH